MEISMCDFLFLFFSSGYQILNTTQKDWTEYENIYPKIPEKITNFFPSRKCLVFKNKRQQKFKVNMHFREGETFLFLT